jgi:hypothetical protein
MIQKLLLFIVALFFGFKSQAQFAATSTNWNVPDLEFQPEDMGSVNAAGYSFVDINGDGYPDLIDVIDNNTGFIWQNSLQRYWKVYLNDGTSISPTPTNWNVPDLEFQPEDMGSVNGAGYSFIDINGDGYPDLIDVRDNNTGFIWQNSFQRYWKVYLNDGTSISPTPTNWNVPDVEFQPEDMGSVNGAGYSFVDINGDGYPDLIDAKDNNSAAGSIWQNGSQRFWKVYLNDGTSISPTAIDWTVPELEFNPEDMASINGAGYSFVDINGDGYPDLIDAKDNNSAAGSIWQNGSQRFWKVYLNDGTSISPTAIDWNVPELEFNPEDMASVNGAGYSFVDINGDRYPDLIDAKDNNSAAGSIWQNGSQRFWKVYLNDGTSISPTAIDWNVPELEFNPEDMASVNGAGYSLIDINGDGSPDLIDVRDNNTGFIWQNSLQRYWKVYLNTVTTSAIQAFGNWDSDITAYPNPFSERFSIDLGATEQNITTTVTDLMGKVIQTNAYSNSQILNISLDKPAGVYFLMLQTADKKAVLKLIKE